MGHTQVRKRWHSINALYKAGLKGFSTGLCSTLPPPAISGQEKSRWERPKILLCVCHGPLGIGHPHAGTKETPEITSVICGSALLRSLPQVHAFASCAGCMERTVHDHHSLGLGSTEHGSRPCKARAVRKLTFRTPS